MKFTLAWLKDFLDTDASLEEISQKLTSIGLEVEEIIDNAKILEPFKVAYIKEAIPHPNADRLKICQIDTGDKTIQLVCGGINARAGIKVVLAAIGTTIPTNGMKMKLTKIREVESHGMLVSLDEMGLGDSEGKIIELPENAKLGDSFAKYLDADNTIIDIAITPNRGDCLGVYGIARDLAATGIGKLKPLKIPSISGEFESPLKVILEDDNCSRFLGRYFKNVSNIPSPAWLQNRLQSIGLKPISALVDITNYISFTFGRPLHVYDADKLNGDIIVRKANKGEKFQALNEIEYEAKGAECAITNDNKIIGFGGIIGEETTGVSMNTKNIFLEVAFFDHISIAETGRSHKIDTDARYRFERKLDPLFIDDGEKLASRMILDICGGVASEQTDTGKINFKACEIEFDPKFIYKRGGVSLPQEEIIRILESLGFGIKKSGDKLLLTVPSYRNDISIKEDIVEEVLRIYGYDNIPVTPLPLNSNLPNKTISHKQDLKSRIKRNLAGRGYYEVVTWSFMQKEHASLFSTLIKELHLANPISSELDYMRPTIIGNLLLAVNKNKARGHTNLALFEVGPIFESVLPEGHRLVVSGVRTGSDSDKNLYSKQREIDVFDIKADIFSFINECGFNPNNFIIDTNNLPDWAHPSKFATLKIGKNIIGYFGEVHPNILKKYNIKDRVYAFEIFIESLPTPKSKKGRKEAPNYSDYQAIQRDFAFIVDNDIEAGQITKSIINTDKKLIQDVNIFDIFSGDNIGEGKKSIAVAVKIQSADKTLTDQEIEKLSQNIISNIAKSTGGTLRSI